MPATELNHLGGLWLYPAHGETFTSSPHHTTLSRLVSGNHLDVGDSALLPTALDVWRVFSSPQREGGCTDIAGFCLYRVLLQS